MGFGAVEREVNNSVVQVGEQGGRWGRTDERSRIPCPIHPSAEGSFRILWGKREKSPVPTNTIFVLYTSLHRTSRTLSARPNHPYAPERGHTSPVFR